MTTRSVVKRVLLGSALTLLALVVVVVGVALWIINTPSGTRWVFGLASNALDGALKVRQIEGAVAGPLTLTGLTYRDPTGGLALVAEHVVVDVEMSKLLRALVHVRNVDARGVSVQLGPTQKEEKPEPSKPFSLRPPIDMQLDRLQVADVSVQREAQMLVEITTASASGAWTDAGVSVRRLDVRSPQGEVHFQAAVSGDEVYVGEGDGRFRWQVDTRTYAGTLQAHSDQALATLNAQLTSPLSARLQIDVEQRESAPWKLSADIPAFDPRKELLPDSSLQRLAASLRGTGNMKQATLTGRVEIDDEPLQIERIHVERGEQDIRLDALLRPREGSIRANGSARLANEPASAKLNLSWQKIVIPESLAGQVLNTQGEMHFDGSAQAYVVDGELRLGPPQQLADIRFDVKGSPQRVQLHRFDIVEKAGQLSATGHIDLQPAIAWQVQARAEHFNPGEFAAAWPGDLNFGLTTRGQIAEQKPQGSLQLTNLHGKLRKRPLRGRADLNLSPDKVLAGTLDVSSGNSRVRVSGEGSDAMNARMTIEVPALDDWLPDSGGELHGQVTATGRWPDLKIAGSMRGSSLHLATTRVEAVALSFDVLKPIDPSGNLSLDVSNATASGLNFNTLKLRADGDAQKHTLRLDAMGQPIAVQLQLHGARTSEANKLGWSGTVEQLVLDVQKAARLQLQQPFDVTYSQQGVRVSQACFADRDIRLCLAGDTESNGAMQAQYSLQNVPLALASALAAPSMPIDISGKIDGEGNIRRDEQGRLEGSATLRSAQGRMAQRSDPALGEPQVLLKYDDLRIAANLDGANGSGNISARLNDTGRLQGDATFSGLGEASTSLRGNVEANLPSIAVVGVFAPQLANVQGQVQLRAGVSGTLDAPRIDGALTATNLATDVPALGLKLRDGRISVTPQPDNKFALDGNISSGKGSLHFDGTASLAGDAQVNVQGQQFLAADIPGAQVTIEPKLQFHRGVDQMLLQGNVHIPSAKVDLSKLPRTQSAQNVSSDVVVIDAKTQEEAQQEALPLETSIQVSLGNDVSLAGFGLDAKVSGQLQVREAPGSPTTGSGEVRVAGTYKAYGQDLTIRQGQLLFAGTPINNPRLSIVAVREIDQQDVVAGLRVEGFATSPQLTVFSEPPMAQSNALAFLVTGKPLSEVGAGEGDAVQSAARSLGTAAGGLLAKNIGRRLGVDEVGVKESEAIGGAALTIGQYLSPRLYLSYGVGLFEPGEVVTLRYKLSGKLTFEALNGSRDSRAGLEYRRER
jgi:translocation and assembly module TamB